MNTFNFAINKPFYSSFQPYNRNSLQLNKTEYKAHTFSYLKTPLIRPTTTFWSIYKPPNHQYIPNHVKSHRRLLCNQHGCPDGVVVITPD